MSNNLNDLVKRYTIKHDRLIKNICAPLKDCLGIPIFTYYTIEEDGRFCILSSCPEQLDFFYKAKLYLTNPYLKHPHLFRSGHTFIQATPDPTYLELSQQRFQVSNLFLTLQRSSNCIEGFLFGTKTTDSKNNINYLNQLDLLNKFSSYFKRETKPLIEQMKKDGYDLKKAKGQAFLEKDASISLTSSDPKTLQFLKVISPLSSREQECLELYKQGHSAQTTAAVLGLSQRTVEHYFENIKNKFGCVSKRELFEL